MKKVLILVGLVVVAVVAVVFVAGSRIDTIVKAAIETVAPRITKTPVTVESVKVSPQTGEGAIQGMVIGNPEGYSGPHAMRLGEVKLSLDPKSVLSDKVHVRSIVVDAPEIVLEGGLSENNLKKILANIDGVSASEKSEGKTTNEGTRKKLQVDDIVLSNAKVQVRIPGSPVQIPPVAIPDVRVQNLGAGPDGITATELAQRLVNEVLQRVMPAVTKAVTDGAGKLGKDAVDAAKGALDKVGAGGKKLGDLFNQKK